MENIKFHEAKVYVNDKLEPSLFFTGKMEGIKLVCNTYFFPKNIRKEFEKQVNLQNKNNKINHHDNAIYYSGKLI